MKRMNFPERRAQRRADAEERAQRTKPERTKAYRRKQSAKA